MTDLMWPPAVILGLTMAQLVCLFHERPPAPELPGWEAF